MTDCCYKAKILAGELKLQTCLFSGECEKKSVILGGEIELIICTKSINKKEIDDFLEIFKSGKDTKNNDKKSKE